MSDGRSISRLVRQWLTSLLPSGSPGVEVGEAPELRFDQARADSIVQKLGIEIAKGSNFNARPWTDLVVVADFKGGRRSMFGYVFWGERDWEAAGPDGWDAIDIVEELHDAMLTPEHSSWQKCRVRITRATGKIDVDFDYSGDKWVPVMSDPAAFAFGLRH